MLNSSMQFIHLFPYTITAGLVIAMVCSVLGVFVVLNRVVFIGITLPETASCGIAVALILHVSPLLGAIVSTLVTVVVLSRPVKNVRLYNDVIMGILFVFASGFGLLIVSQSGFGLEEVKTLLYGDLILISSRDMASILTVCIPVIALLFVFYRPILYTFLDREAALILGVRASLFEFLFYLSLGLTVSASAKSAGTLLVFCYLVVAPAAAFLLSRRLRMVLLISSIGAIGSTIIGLVLSFEHDFPANPTIAVVCCAWFVTVFTLVYSMNSLRRLVVSSRKQSSCSMEQ